MARRKKEFNKNGVFQRRFTELWYKSGRTQEQLAKALGVTRPTVVGWSDGKNLPDIESLERIARLFNVSADYLLGLSDTVSPDVNLRAAVEYTGLSEAAVEWLHMGLDDFECGGVGLAEDDRKRNLSTASGLIQSKAFTKIVKNLNEVSEAAYLDKILNVLLDEYSECDSLEDTVDFCYASQDDRDVVVANLIHVLETLQYYPDESIPDKVKALSDEELAMYVINAQIGSGQDNELHQFHAAKAFTGYIDQMVEESHQRALSRFKKV